MKFSITALCAMSGLLLAQSTLGAALPCGDDGTSCGRNGDDEFVDDSTAPYKNTGETTYPADGEGLCETCSKEPPAKTSDNDACSDSTLYQIHPKNDTSLCVAVAIDIDNKVDGSKLVHLEPCDWRELARNWNLQTVKGDISDGSLNGPTLLRLEDSIWCLDTTSSTPGNGWLPHLYNCSDAANPWAQQDWYIGEYDQLQMRDPASGNKTCLDIVQGNFDARALQMWECDLNGANDNQEWVITKATVKLSEDPKNPPLHPHVDRD